MGSLRPPNKGAFLPDYPETEHRNLGSKIGISRFPGSSSQQPARLLRQKPNDICAQSLPVTVTGSLRTCTEFPLSLAGLTPALTEYLIMLIITHWLCRVNSFAGEV